MLPLTPVFTCMTLCLLLECHPAFITAVLKVPRSSCLASKPPPCQQCVTALCSTFHQHDAHMGQEHAINAKIKTKLVPKLLFEELSQITPPGLRSPPSALIASSSYQQWNSSDNLFCLQQHQLFHT